MTAPHLVIDGGKSKTAAAAVDADGRVLASVTGPGLAMIGEPGGADALTRSLAATLAQLDMRPPAFATAVFGLNGVHSPSREVDAAAAILRGLVTAQRIVVTSDGVLGYVGAMGTGPGVAVTAGTGSVILAVGADGFVHRVDGDGPLLGDRGSGYAIGLAGLRVGMRVVDGLDGSSVLAEELRREYGTADDAVRSVHGSSTPTKLIAAFSRNVARAAERGDPMATAIWRHAGADLARGVLAAARRAGLADSFEVATSGGLFRVGSLLSEPFADELHRLAGGARLRPAAGDALAGGAVLARSPRPVLAAVSSWVPGTPA
ncbi:MAG TPA: BadF/BadG/BcrA/BcrD ATPase family protein [Pseudolysinimonas sp.]|nr:BadF/BadG/BcrA/BcrD ATPase family protein [Pseudolysinimonas sp.]